MTPDAQIGRGGNLDRSKSIAPEGSSNNTDPSIGAAARNVLAPDASNVEMVVVPTPAAGLDVHGICQSIEAWAATTEDIGALKDNKSKLSAIDQYLASTSTEGRAAISATVRRLEQRISEVIGAASNGGDRVSDQFIREGTALTPNERNDFRKMAANPDVVDRVLAESTDAAPASRAKVLEAIKGAANATPKRTPLPDAAKRAGWELRRAIERVERIFADDRFNANKEQVANYMAGHLAYTVEVCNEVIDLLPSPLNTVRTVQRGRRRKHRDVLAAVITGLDGYAIGLNEITALDSTVTSGEAAHLTGDLQRNIRVLTRINNLIKDRVTA